MNPRTDPPVDHGLWTMIKDIRIAMLATEDESGALHARPMMAHQEGFDGQLWFFTRSDSPKVGEVERHHQVNLSYVKPEAEAFISVSGWAEPIHDVAKARELWNDSLLAWFPRGPEDPEVELLRVKVEHAEFWDRSSSVMRPAYG